MRGVERRLVVWLVHLAGVHGRGGGHHRPVSTAGVGLLRGCGYSRQVHVGGARTGHSWAWWIEQRVGHVRLLVQVRRRAWRPGRPRFDVLLLLRLRHGRRLRVRLGNLLLVLLLLLLKTRRMVLERSHITSTDYTGVRRSCAKKKKKSKNINNNNYKNKHSLLLVRAISCHRRVRETKLIKSRLPPQGLYFFFYERSSLCTHFNVYGFIIIVGRMGVGRNDHARNPIAILGCRRRYVSL